MLDSAARSASPTTEAVGLPSTSNSNWRGQDEQNTRYATSSQVRAIKAICNRQGVDPVRLASERYRVDDLEELTLREASSLIDELKSTPTGGRNGGGR